MKLTHSGATGSRSQNPPFCCCPDAAAAAAAPRPDAEIDAEWAAFERGISRSSARPARLHRVAPGGGPLFGASWRKVMSRTRAIQVLGARSASASAHAEGGESPNARLLKFCAAGGSSEKAVTSGSTRQAFLRVSVGSSPPSACSSSGFGSGVGARAEAPFCAHPCANCGRKYWRIEGKTPWSRFGKVSVSGRPL